MLWASEFGRTSVARFLLDRGMQAGERLPRHGVFHGATALHLAAFGGHAETVRLLLQRGAPIGVTDETFGTAPLNWALYAWAYETPASPPANHYDVVAQLVGAGARPDSYWLAHEKVRDDRRMLTALGQPGTS